VDPAVVGVSAHHPADLRGVHVVDDEGCSAAAVEMNLGTALPGSGSPMCWALDW
jgi:hypothetical protein